MRPVLDRHLFIFEVPSIGNFQSSRRLCNMQINALTNDTGKLFNWHPFLMAIAFPLLMGEALLAYRAPLAPKLST